MYYVTPAEGELFQRFSPELQASNLANRERRMRQHEDFMGKLREYSKSDLPIWEAAKQAERRERDGRLEKERQEGWERERVMRGEEERRRAEIRREAGMGAGAGAGAAGR